MTNSAKNLLLGLKIIIWLCVLFSSAKPLASNNCCKTHHQPNSFTHSLTNLLYWAYWAHILFYLDLGYDLWPYNIYIYIYNSICFNKLKMMMNIRFINYKLYNPNLTLKWTLFSNSWITHFMFNSPTHQITKFVDDSMYEFYSTQDLLLLLLLL